MLQFSTMLRICCRELLAGHFISVQQPRDVKVLDRLQDKMPKYAVILTSTASEFRQTPRPQNVKLKAGFAR